MPIDSRSDYRHALERLNDLFSRGRSSETCEETRRLEGEIAEYVCRDGEPDLNLGRPSQRRR